MRSLNHAALTQRQITWYSCTCSGNDTVSVVLQEPFNNPLHKTKNCTCQMTNWRRNLTAKHGALHKSLKKTFVFRLFVLFRFVSFKLERSQMKCNPHDCITITQVCKLTSSHMQTAFSSPCTGSHNWARNCSLPPQRLCAAISWNSQLRSKPYLWYSTAHSCSNPDRTAQK